LDVGRAFADCDSFGFVLALRDRSAMSGAAVAASVRTFVAEDLLPLKTFVAPDLRC
jgi:hypothetical protein